MMVCMLQEKILQSLAFIAIVMLPLAVGVRHILLGSTADQLTSS